MYIVYTCVLISLYRDKEGVRERERERGRGRDGRIISRLALLATYIRKSLIFVIALISKDLG